MSHPLIRTVGIIDLKPTAALPRSDASTRDLASTLNWLGGEVENRKITKLRFDVEPVGILRPVDSVFVDADLFAMYSELEDELRRLAAC